MSTVTKVRIIFGMRNGSEIFSIVSSYSEKEVENIADKLQKELKRMSTMSVKMPNGNKAIVNTDAIDYITIDTDL